MTLRQIGGAVLGGTDGLPPSRDADHVSEGKLIAHRPQRQSAAIDDIETLADLGFQRLVAHLHRLGPRATFHLLDRIACRFMARSWLEHTLLELATLNPKTIIALGADQLPQPPLRAITGGRR